LVDYHGFESGYWTLGRRYSIDPLDRRWLVRIDRRRSVEALA
jgi:hypothetical protein